MAKNKQKVAGVFVLTLLFVIASTDNSHNEVGKTKTLEQELLGSIGGLKVDILSIRSHLAKLSRRSKLIYSMLKEKKEQADVLGTPAEGSPCPPAFSLERRSPGGTVSCYRAETERVSWSQARRRCRTWHARLVAIEDETEQNFLTNYFKDHREFHHCDLWTDGSDQVTEADWRWYTADQPFNYTHWHTWEPNNGSGLEHCMWLDWYFHWAWNDARCERDKACYVCEIEVDE